MLSAEARERLADLLDDDQEFLSDLDRLVADGQRRQASPAANSSAVKAELEKLQRAAEGLQRAVDSAPDDFISGFYLAGLRRELETLLYELTWRKRQLARARPGPKGNRRAVAAGLAWALERHGVNTAGARDLADALKILLRAAGLGVPSDLRPLKRAVRDELRVLRSRRGRLARFRRTGEN